MKAIKGALSALIIVAVFYLTPPEHDPIFMGLPWKLQMSCFLGWLGSATFGVALFFDALSSQPEVVGK